jgi:hypothetical protein
MLTITKATPVVPPANQALLQPTEAPLSYTFHQTMLSLPRRLAPATTLS